MQQIESTVTVALRGFELVRFACVQGKLVTFHIEYYITTANMMDRSIGIALASNSPSRSLMIHFNDCTRSNSSVALGWAQLDLLLLAQLKVLPFHDWIFTTGHYSMLLQTWCADPSVFQT